MVLLHVKTSRDLEFMLEAQTTEQIAKVLQRLVTVHNCCLCILYWKEVWKEFSASMSQCTGVPQESMQDIKKAFEAAQSLLNKEDACRRMPLTEGALEDALEAIRCSFPSELAGSLPEKHPLLPLLTSGQPTRQTAAGVGGQLRSLDVDDAVLWFNHKRMLPDSKLSDYVGRNEKTKANVQLHHSDHGRPIRAVDKDAEKTMLAYYFKKQEEQKVLEAAAEGILAESTAWAHPHALKRHLQAVSHIQLPRQ